MLLSAQTSSAANAPMSSGGQQLLTPKRSGADKSDSCGL